MKTTPKERDYFRRWAGGTALGRASNVVVTDLLDDLAELEAERDALKVMVETHRCDERAEAAFRRAVAAEAERDALMVMLAPLDQVRALLARRDWELSPLVRVTARSLAKRLTTRRFAHRGHTLTKTCHTSGVTGLIGSDKVLHLPVTPVTPFATYTPREGAAFPRTPKGDSDPRSSRLSGGANKGR